MVCPRCGTSNTPDAKFCVSCGNPLAGVAQPQVPSAPYPSAAPGLQPHAAYDYAAAMAAQDRTRQIDRTKTGLLLLLIGIILGPIPYVNFVGGILVIIGAILVILGRNAFGPAHSRNTIWAVIIFIISIGVIVAGAVAFALAILSATIANSTGNTIDPTVLAQSLSSSFTTLLILAAVGGAVGGIANVLFTYAIQNQTGRILLWAGYAAGIAISIFNIIVIGPLITNAASQSFNGTTYDPAPFNNLQSQLQTLQLLGFIPAILYAAAVYLVWSRIGGGELPGPAI